MRDKIWARVRKNIPVGQILPKWAIAVRAILFPLDFFFWRMSQVKGYQWETDTWLIEGVHYSNEVFRSLADSAGELYQVRREGKIVVFECISKRSMIVDPHFNCEWRCYDPKCYAPIKPISGPSVNLDFRRKDLQ
jgi:hypothetical protein